MAVEGKIARAASHDVKVNLGSFSNFTCTTRSFCKETVPRALIWLLLWWPSSERLQYPKVELIEEFAFNWEIVDYILECRFCNCKIAEFPSNVTGACYMFTQNQWGSNGGRHSLNHEPVSKTDLWSAMKMQSGWNWLLLGWIMWSYATCGESLNSVAACLIFFKLLENLRKFVYMPVQRRAHFANPADEPSASALQFWPFIHEW